MDQVLVGYCSGYWTSPVGSKESDAESNWSLWFCYLFDFMLSGIIDHFPTKLPLKSYRNPNLIELMSFSLMISVLVFLTASSIPKGEDFVNYEM